MISMASTSWYSTPLLALDIRVKLCANSGVGAARAAGEGGGPLLGGGTGGAGSGGTVPAAAKRVLRKEVQWTSSNFRFTAPESE